MMFKPGDVVILDYKGAWGYGQASGKKGVIKTKEQGCYSVLMEDGETYFLVGCVLTMSTPGGLACGPCDVKVVQKGG